jgi:hypothetical protein
LIALTSDYKRRILVGRQSRDRTARLMQLFHYFRVTIAGGNVQRVVTCDHMGTDRYSS